MKRLLLIFTVFTFLSAFSLSAQTSLILGVDAGISFDKLNRTGDFNLNNTDSRSAFGYQGGINAGLKFGGFSLLSGIHYNKYGSKHEKTGAFRLGDGTIVEATIFEDWNYSVLNIPLLLRYETRGDLKFFLTAGPMFNIGMGEAIFTYKEDIVGYENEPPQEFKYSFGRHAGDYLRTLHMSFYISTGIMYKVTEDGLFKFNIAYDVGGDMANENFSIQAIKMNGSMKRSSFQIGIGYEHRIDFKAGTKY